MSSGTRRRTRRAPAAVVSLVKDDKRYERSTFSPHHRGSAEQDSIRWSALASTDVAFEVPFSIASCGGPCDDSATAGGARAADDYPGMDASEGSRGSPASSVEWIEAREGSGARYSRQAPIAGPTVGGMREYECSDTGPSCRTEWASAVNVALAADNDG